MKANRTSVLVVAMALFFLGPKLSLAQAVASISGAVTNASGTAVPDASVTVKNITTGQSIELRTDASGKYTVANLAPGDYEVSVSANALAPKVTTVTLGAGAAQKLDVVLGAENPQAPSLSDLGFTPNQTQGSAQQQALLDKRSHMLKIHQRLGLITAAPLAATVITGGFAGGRRVSSTNRDLHAVLGSSTAILYFSTAYFAIRAPKITGTPTRGPIRLHKALAWIHGPGMVLTPILGAIAFQQKSNGEKVHGIASWHGPVGIITAGAYAAAILAVSVKL
jgi:hypothetical protein